MGLSVANNIKRDGIPKPILLPAIDHPDLLFVSKSKMMPLEDADMSTYFEPTPADPFDPTGVVRSCIESGAHALLLDEAALSPNFFDLSSGAAGELLHKLSVYRMRMAAVVPDLSRHSANFQAFAREANKGNQFRFFPTRQEAVAWLEKV